jgi:hypothetical protein
MAKPRKTAGRPGPSAAAHGPRLYTLEVRLLSGPLTEKFARDNPVVARTVKIRGDQTLEDLHEALYEAFDREEEQMWEFQFGRRPMDRQGPRYGLPEPAPGAFGDDEPGRGDAASAPIEALGLRVRRRFFYCFDFGDDWWHEVKVKAVQDAIPPGNYPKVTDRVGASPPQYPDPDEEDE